MVEPSYYIWLLIFGIFSYICIVDSNVMKFVYLVLQIVRINTIRFFWGNKMRIGLEISRWKMKKDMKKFLKERNK